MKIAYLLHWNDLPESGVFKKIFYQISQWVDMGADVKVFLLTKNEKWNKNSTTIPIEIKHYSTAYNRLTSSYSLVRKINEWEPDLIYTRYDLYNPIFELLSGAPLVFEVNTDDLMEYSRGGFLREKYNILTRGHYLKMAEGIIFVTEEISKRAHFKTDKKVKVISNGVDLQLYSILPAPQNNIPNLLFIGTEGAIWHGTDKIETLASIFPEWIFHIIGKSSLENIEIKNNIIYYPFLEKKDYQVIMEKADIAIGSLALHRININQACPLKVREYLAYGLPIIIGYEDIDIKGHDGVLQIANSEDNIDEFKAQIEEFVQEWKGKRIDPTEFNIDAREKEIERINFFKEIIEVKIKLKSSIISKVIK